MRGVIKMMNKVFIGFIAFLVIVCGGLGYWSFDLHGRINTLHDDTQAFEADTAGQFSTVKSDISSVDSSLTGFKADTTDKFTSVDNDITGVQSRVTDLNTDLSTFKSDTTSMFNSTQNSIASLGTELDESTMNVRQVYDSIIGGVCEIIGNIATGSGLIYSADGYILTCWHVVDGQSYLDVILHDGTCRRATVVGSDRSSDVAVLKINVISDLQPLPLADSGTLVPGEPVIVVGNPFGIFETVVYGIISRTTQMVYVSGVGWVSNLIQYDAAQNPGNSGSPVFNGEGQVVGMAETSLTSAEGIKCAVSSNKVKKVADAIIENGYFENAILPGSWSLGDLTPEIAIQRGLDSSFGCILLNVSGMDGVQANDIIVKVDGVVIRDAADLFSYIAEFKNVGDIIVLTLVRGGGTQIEASLTLVEGWLAY
jgi:S1-C subfamily serine protease